MKLRLLEDQLMVCRLEPDQPLPPAPAEGFWSITRTPHEISIVCAAGQAPDQSRQHGPWQALEVAGPLAFAQTGILAELSAVLSQAGVSIFALATWDTDYLLVEGASVQAACVALRQSGHQVDGADPT